MKRLIALSMFLPVIAAAAIWPENFGTAKRVSAQPAGVSDQALWNEYGLKEAETARYEAGDKQFTATAYRLQDSTGALGAFEWQRPADAKPSKVAPLSAEAAGGVIAAHGNYVLVVQGYKPGPEEFTALLRQLPRVENARLPALYLPEENVVPNSERYVVGPAGLARFEPGIPPSVAGFHYGVEAQIASFRQPRGTMRMALFNYPNHQIAMQQYEAFNKVPGAMAKRSGPLIAVIVSPSDSDAAEHLLSLVRYQAAVTMSEHVPTQKDNVGDLIVNIFELTGILLLFAMVSGIAFGGIRTLFRRGAKGQEADPMILLHLGDR